MAKRTERVAVFARNHRGYLDEAVARNAARPERFTTFRSSKRWVRAHAANVEHGTLKIYFAPLGGDKGIEYAAMLHRVHLDPNADDPVTQEVLFTELESTRKEGLWEQFDQKVQTLYVISHCEQLVKPFPITELIKASDGTPISQDYSYSYSLVREHQPVPASDFETYPEEIPEPSRYFEGATKTVSVNVYERSSGARAACLAHHGHACAVCKFDFEATYGELGQGFIHVHHLKFLSTVDQEYEVDPIEDLCPVCPNCHAMIHRTDPPLSIGDLRKRLMAQT
jgi:hypothetical protein